MKNHYIFYIFIVHVSIFFTSIVIPVKSIKAQGVSQFLGSDPNNILKGHEDSTEATAIIEGTGKNNCITTTGECCTKCSSITEGTFPASPALSGIDDQKAGTSSVQ